MPNTISQTTGGENMRLRDKAAKLRCVARNLGYSIKPGNGSMCDVPTETIKIDPKQTLRNSIYTLAHEIGHAKTLSSCGRKFGKALADKSEKSYAVLEAEFKAWERANALVQQMGLYDKKYLKFKHHLLRLYYKN